MIDGWRETVSGHVARSLEALFKNAADIHVVPLANGDTLLVDTGGEHLVVQVRTAEVCLR